MYCIAAFLQDSTWAGCACKYSLQSLRILFINRFLLQQIVYAYSIVLYELPLCIQSVIARGHKELSSIVSYRIALVYEPKCVGGGSQPMSSKYRVQLCTWSPNKLWWSLSYFYYKKIQIFVKYLLNDVECSIKIIIYLVSHHCKNGRDLNVLKISATRMYVITLCSIQYTVFAFSSVSLRKIKPTVYLRYLVYLIAYQSDLTRTMYVCCQKPHIFLWRY